MYRKLKLGRPQKNRASSNPARFVGFENSSKIVTRHPVSTHCSNPVPGWPCITEANGSLARCISFERARERYGLSLCYVAVRMVARPLSAAMSYAREHQRISSASDVRFGSKADICSASTHVRFTPESGHVRCS
jgi:hypothetical protein